MRKAHIVPIEQRGSEACSAAVAMHSSSKAEFFSGIETDGASASITLKDSALKLLCKAREQLCKFRKIAALSLPGMVSRPCCASESGPHDPVFCTQAVHACC